MKKKSKKFKKPLPVSTEMPDHKKHQIMAVAKSHLHAGPLPPPEVLIKYNEAVPNAADRIITMAESQSAHRQQLESEVVESDVKNSRLGLLYGLIIGLTAVIGGTVCIVSGYEAGGSILGSTGLTGLVGVFVYGSRSKRKEREERFKAEIAANAT